MRRKGRIATEAPKVILNEEIESARMLAGYSVKSDRGILAAMASPMRDQPETTGDLLLGIKDQMILLRKSGVGQKKRPQGRENSDIGG